MKLIPIDKPRNTKENITTENDLLSQCGVVYKKIESGVYEFEEMLDPDKDYPEDRIAYTFRSVYVGVAYIAKGTSVWNVKGSTHDPFSEGANVNWLGIWNEKTKNDLNRELGKCYVHGSIKTNGTSYCRGFTIGGHMALSIGSVTPSINDHIYIIPICTSHNNAANEAEMTVCEDVEAVEMTRFMQI